MESTRVILLVLISVLDVAYSTENTLIRNKRWGGSDDGSSMFRGTAGVDYPDLKTIPTTSFTCEDKIYDGGLYADTEAYCQVYHVCHEGRKSSFLCGKGTIFNQQILTCDYWYSAECENAPDYYHLNSQIGKPGSPGSHAFKGSPYPIGSPQESGGAQPERGFPVGPQHGSSESQAGSGQPSVPQQGSGRPQPGNPTGPQRPSGSQSNGRHPSGQPPRSGGSRPGSGPQSGSHGTQPGRGYPSGPQQGSGGSRPGTSNPSGPQHGSQSGNGYPSGPHSGGNPGSQPESSRFRPGSGYPSGPQPGRGHPTGPQQESGYPSGPQQESSYPSGPQPGRGYPSGPQQGSGHQSGPQGGSDYPSGPQPESGYPSPDYESQPASGYPSGPQPGNGYPRRPQTGSGYPSGNRPESGIKFGGGKDNARQKFNAQPSRPLGRGGNNLNQVQQSEISYDGQKSSPNRCECAPQSQNKPWSFPMGMMPGNNDK